MATIAIVTVAGWRILVEPLVLMSSENKTPETIATQSVRFAIVGILNENLNATINYYRNGISFRQFLFEQNKMYGACFTLFTYILRNVTCFLDSKKIDAENKNAAKPFGSIIGQQLKVY